VATDQSKVHESLREFTVDARVGGDLNENNHLAKKARERVENAVLVFSTCAGNFSRNQPFNSILKVTLLGAGLGTLRKQDFDIAIIDEASQITEPTALVPLVKGVKKAIMVGDQ
jgi:superfamily I DNA and/or RNA helicase